MSLLNTTRTCVLLTLVIACGGQSDADASSAPKGAQATPGAAASETEVALAELDADEIPSQDVADAAAEEAIDDSNADEAFDALMAEINNDG